MKKNLWITLTLALALCVGVSTAAFAGGFSARADEAENETAVEKLDDFTDDFESYEVGGYIEDDTSFAAKWENNILCGGEPLGMDSHISQKAKVVYEIGESGNKVLSVQNQTGANTYFYIGPTTEFRVKNFTASFKVKFLTAGVEERSWVGFSFRKKAQVHYTGTDNLMFYVQRYVRNGVISAHAFKGPDDLDSTSMRDLYGERLSVTRENYEVPGLNEYEDCADFITVKLVADGRNYKLYANDFLMVDCTYNVASFDHFGYISLNCCTSNILVDDFTVEVQDESLPPEIPALPAPEVTHDTENNQLTWKRVSGASGYRVSYGDSVDTVYTPKFSLSALKAGEYDITVTAITDDAFEHKNSAPSEAIHVVVVEGKAEGGDGGKKGCGSSAAASCTAAAVALMAAGGVLALIRRRRTA